MISEDLHESMPVSGEAPSNAFLDGPWVGKEKQGFFGHAVVVLTGKQDEHGNSEYVQYEIVRKLSTKSRIVWKVLQ